MITSLDASSSRFLRSLADLNSRLDRRQAEIASGLRLRVPSDQPDNVGRLLAVRAETARLEQTGLNLSRVRTEVDTAEMSLQAAALLFDRARALAAQSAGTTQTAASRAVIAADLDGIVDRMVALANTEVDGRFLFSGDSDQTVAYSLDPQATPPWGAYLGSPATRQALDPQGLTFPIARSAQEIFDDADPSRNVFQAIDTLRQALRANDVAALRASLEALPTVSQHINNMLAGYGIIQRQVGEAAETTSRLQVRFKSEQANLEDADITEAFVEVQQLRFQQEAALQVRASLPRTSLFDFLA